MVARAFSHFRSWIRLSQSQIPGIPKSRSKIFSIFRNLPHAETAKGFFLLSISLLSGHLAHQFSQLDAIETWKENEIPTLQTWRRTLGPLSYFQVTQSHIQRRAYRTLPTQTDEKGSIWTTPDFNWILIFTDEPGGYLFPVFFCRLKRVQSIRPRKKVPKDLRASFPKNWQPFDQGWPGLQALLKVVSKKPLPPVIRRRPPQPQTDPKEIRY